MKIKEVKEDKSPKIVMRESLFCWCQRCSHSWYAKDKDELPLRCPRCGTPYWNREKKNNMKTDLSS